MFVNRIRTFFFRLSVVPGCVLVLVSGVLVGACGEPGSQDAVATVSLQLDRLVVPLGGTVQMSVRFVVAPDLQPLSEDYRVMIHFLDANGDMMWTDDHDPVTPTSQWQPSQTISYTRRLHIPMYPYIGEAVVSVGLYSPVTGERLVLAGEPLGQRAYRGTVVSLEPQPESSFLMYQAGWHDDELNQDANESWRWTSEHASLAFRNPRSDAMFYLELDGRPELFDPPQQLSIRIGDETVREITIDSPASVFYEIPLVATLFGDSDTVTIDLVVSETFVPSATPNGAPGDDRSLGVRVFYAFVEPR